MSPARFTIKLVGQRVLVIGGMGEIGISVAPALLEFGAAVTGPPSQNRVSGHACDLASTEVEANLEKLFKQVGEIDHVVYMAGDRLPTIPLKDVTLEKWQRFTQVRSIAGLLVAKVGVMYLKKNRRSSITFTGDSISEQPMAGGWSILGSLGAGINGMTRQLAFDLAPIRVNAVAPGVVETDFLGQIGR